MAAVHYHEGRFPPEERIDWPALIPLIGPAVVVVDVGGLSASGVVQDDTGAT